MAEVKQRKIKNRLSARTNVIITITCAVIAALLIFLVLYLCGLRYVKYNFADGFSVTFVGVTDINGYPKNGRLSYSGSDDVDGLTATVNEKDGTIEYSNGDVYKGEMQDLVKHGQGKLTYENGDVYEGGFIADKPSGEGILTFSNGDKYVGGFKNGKRHGEGTYTYADGSTYEGSFEGGVKHGEGIYRSIDGSVYEGS